MHTTMRMSAKVAATAPAGTVARGDRRSLAAERSPPARAERARPRLLLLRRQGLLLLLLLWLLLLLLLLLLASPVIVAEPSSLASAASSSTSDASGRPRDVRGGRLLPGTCRRSSSNNCRRRRCTSSCCCSCWCWCDRPCQSPLRLAGENPFEQDVVMASSEKASRRRDDGEAGMALLDRPSRPLNTPFASRP